MSKKVYLLLFVLILSICCSSVVFADTELDNRDYSVLKTLEIMVGDDNGDMRFEDTITRAEFTKVATMLSSYRNSIALNQKTSPFYDVPYKHWAVGYIRAGVDNGIITGYPDSTFKPDNDVLYEEALTILLKILGYGGGSDFQGSYPYSQYSLANSIDLTEGVEAELGDFLTRKQVADLLLNALDTKIKNSNLTLYSNFNVQKYEEVILLATSKEDVSVPLNKILTTVGTFDYDINIENLIGSKGNIYVENGDTIILFENDNNVSETEKYVVYSTLADGVIIYKNGSFEQVEIEDNTITYYNNKQSVFSTVKYSIKMGDTISIYTSENEEIDYINISKGDLKGPFVFTQQAWFDYKIGNPEDYLILKNGNVINYLEVEDYDVYYYSTELSIIMVYNTKVTGVYNNAVPNQEVPVSVEISGKNYEIESAEAFKALSSTGKFKYGDTITVLLGRDKKIAGVIPADSVKSNTVGYLIDAGIKNYTTENDKQESKYYITLVTPDGESIEYKSRTDYSNYKNSIVEITFKGDLASLTKVREGNKKNVSGTFNSESMYLGEYIVSKNVDIIDIGTTDNYKTALYVPVTPQRLDGVRLSSSSILYYELNEKNVITKLILHNVTGDYYSYGVVTKVNKNHEMMMGSYTYNIDGSERVYTSQNSVLGVSKGPAKIIYNGNTISSMTNLSKPSGQIKEINNTFVTVNDTHYLIDDDVKIFYNNYNWDYMLITMEELLSDEDYNIVGVYYDKPITSGGRIRVILVRKSS